MIFPWTIFFLQLAVWKLDSSVWITVSVSLWAEQRDVCSINWSHTARRKVGKIITASMLVPADLDLQRKQMCCADVIHTCTRTSYGTCSTYVLRAATGGGRTFTGRRRSIIVSEDVRLRSWLHNIKLSSRAVLCEQRMLIGWIISHGSSFDAEYRWYNAVL